MSITYVLRLCSSCSSTCLHLASISFWFSFVFCFHCVFVNVFYWMFFVFSFFVISACSFLFFSVSWLFSLLIFSFVLDPQFVFSIRFCMFFVELLFFTFLPSVSSSCFWSVVFSLFYLPFIVFCDFSLLLSLLVFAPLLLLFLVFCLFYLSPNKP